MRVIDFHTHIFPDKIAEEALKRLSEHSGPYSPKTNGTLSGLLSSMDHAGVELSVVANIATKPTQVEPILTFSQQILSERIYPLVSFHPDNSLAEVEELLRKASSAGLKGIKLHPMYQDFFIDEEKMFPYYELVSKHGFFLFFHTGFDIAFPGNTQAEVERIARLAEQFPSLTIVATHTGGWKQWDRIGVLTGYENIYTEISMTITEVSEEEFVDLLHRFDSQRIFFGTDSPWTDQKEMIDRLLRLPLSRELTERLLYDNARRFLDRYRV